MLDLESQRWTTLSQAYGDGRTVAVWLRDFTASRDFSDARQTFFKTFDAYGHLCHQETVFPAAFAAIPHIVEYAARLPLPEQLKFRIELLKFVGFTAACALAGEPPPEDLSGDYRNALGDARRLIAETMALTDDEDSIRFLCEALAGATENYDLFDHIRHFNTEPICLECGEPLVCPDCGSADDE